MNSPWDRNSHALPSENDGELIDNLATAQVQQRLQIHPPSQPLGVVNLIAIRLQLATSDTIFKPQLKRQGSLD